ncbi:MAG: hypothetical protein JNL82_39750 [Myxococcales bacterium]|nr:hypothetical protein [Myxococcales bacterium]
MREFVFSATVARMSRAPLVLTLLAGCISPAYEQYLQHGDGAGASSSSGDANADETTASTGEAASTSSGSADGTGASAADTIDTTSGDTTSTSTTGSAEDPSVGDAEKPEILDVMLPAEVYAAGPVPITVETRHTAVVHVQLDGVDLGELLAAGDGNFKGELPVHGAVDNGMHEVEVIATQGPLAAHQTAHYNVQAPKPGTEAWSQEGPKGSRTNRVAVTPAGDLIEVGQTETGGVARPTIRKRSGVTGAELWPEGTITLDAGEGAAVDVAVLPDGRMWVAMNVREPMQDPRPRIALLDADGHVAGADILGTSGRMVRAVAADAGGGCFAAGIAGVQGDWDFAYWRIDAAGLQTLGDVYDYVPAVMQHTFRDAATDVVIDGDVAWVIGMSQGPHDNLPIRTRGILVPMDLHTGEVFAPVIVAPSDGGWTQSVFFGGARHPEGVLVTGYGCDDACDLYRIETSLYTASGERPWHATESPLAALVYGSDVTLDSQGRALVAGAVTQNGKLRGYVFGRMVGQDGQLALEHEYPGLGPSEALGIARDGFDRIFPAGYVTVSGELQARITWIHG